MAIILAHLLLIKVDSLKNQLEPTIYNTILPRSPDCPVQAQLISLGLRRDEWTIWKGWGMKGFQSQTSGKEMLQIRT